MSDINSQIQARVEGFVNELSQLVRQAAIDAVADVLKVDAPRRAAAAAAPPRLAPPARIPAPKGRPAGKAPTARATAAAKRRAGEKRTPAELNQITDRVGDYIKSNPGQGIEQIAKSLTTSTKELTLPVKKLLGEKKIFAKGQKRATRYFPRA
jgi:hypothetical protein